METERKVLCNEHLQKFLKSLPITKFTSITQVRDLECEECETPQSTDIYSAKVY